jgi:hypothetical protein
MPLRSYYQKIKLCHTINMLKNYQKNTEVNMNC